MRLIEEKLAVPPLHAILSRPRLLGVLEQSLRCCTSTILNGRTGAGKTVLATDFAGRCGRRIAWFKVDASDIDPRRFFHYLFASVRRQRPGFDSDGLYRRVRDRDRDVSLLAEDFVYELVESGGEPLLTVIDDLHLVFDAEWFAPFFQRLLPLLPADAHVIMAGRSLPPAPLWRMRSKQMVRVVDEPALAFTVHEAEALFKRFGLPGTNVDDVLEKTRGRAATLEAAVRSLAVPEQFA